MNNGRLIFVDCEAYGGCPSMGRLTEFGAVTWSSVTFHSMDYAGDLSKMVLSSDGEKELWEHFHYWLGCNVDGHPIFVSDNPAFDWQWINDGFLRCLGYNPFGHSARRIGDFYAGLTGNFRNASKWKRLRVTKHDHNPVHDALGNLEAFKRMLNGER